MTGMDKDNQKPMVHVEHLKKYFPVRKKGILKAVDDVSFDICAGETLGLGGVGMRQDDLRTNRRKAVSGHLGDYRVRRKRCKPVKDEG